MSSILNMDTFLNEVKSLMERMAIVDNGKGSISLLNEEYLGTNNLNNDANKDKITNDLNQNNGVSQMPNSSQNVYYLPGTQYVDINSYYMRDTSMPEGMGENIPIPLDLAGAMFSQPIYDLTGIKELKFLVSTDREAQYIYDTLCISQGYYNDITNENRQIFNEGSTTVGIIKWLSTKVLRNKGVKNVTKKAIQSATKQYMKLCDTFQNKTVYALLSNSNDKEQLPYVALRLNSQGKIEPKQGEIVYLESKKVSYGYSTVKTDELTVYTSVPENNIIKLEGLDLKNIVVYDGTTYKPNNDLLNSITQIEGEQCLKIDNNFAITLDGNKIARVIDGDMNTVKPRFPLNGIKSYTWRNINSFKELEGRLKRNNKRKKIIVTSVAIGIGLSVAVGYALKVTFVRSLAAKGQGMVGSAASELRQGVGTPAATKKTVQQRDSLNNRDW